MKITKKKIAIGVGALAIVAIGVTQLMPKAPQGVMVTTSPVLQKDIQSTLSLKAPLEGTESVEIVSRLHYEILSINIKEGDKVTKDQVLANLNTSDLEKEIAVLKDNIQLLKIQNNENKNTSSASYLLAEEKMSDSLEESQRQYEAALETKKTTESTYQNIKVLFDSGMASQTELDDANNAFNEAQRALDSYNVVNGKVTATAAQIKELENSKSTINSASAAKSIEIAEKELQRKREDLEDCIIKSTIEGTVTRVNSNVGRFADEIDNDKPIFVIENIDTLKMDVEVSEYDIDKLAVGQKVKISADILKGETVEGIVARISPTGEEKNGTTERVIPIQIEIDSDTKGLIAGITATAKIEVASSKNALVIPIEALIDNGDDTYGVQILNEDNTIKFIPVEIGVEDVLEIEIISDELQIDDKVVLNPDSSLEDGMSVIAQ